MIKTQIQVLDQILNIIKLFDNTVNKLPFENPGKLLATIDEVGFTDIINLYNLLDKGEKQIYQPGELDQDFITIIYIPTPNCVIEIESIPVFKVDKNYKKYIINPVYQKN